MVVLCGPSGVGKSTMVKQAFEDPRWQGRASLVVSHTTRAPRKNEENGVHYNFVDRETMERMIEGGEFLEHAEVHGQLYGTSFAAVEEARRDGRICILDIDLQGVKNVRKQLVPDGRLAAHAEFTKFVLFRAEGGVSTLEKRLRERSSESEEQIQRRLRTAEKEIKEYSAMEWDREIENKQGKIEVAFGEFAEVLQTLGGQDEDEDGDEFSAYASRLLEQGDESVTIMDTGAGTSAALGTSARRAVKGQARTSQVQRMAVGSPHAAPLGVVEERAVPTEASRKNVFVEFSGLARELGENGVDLGQGFPNFDPPDFVVQALRDELEGHSGGSPRVRHQYTRTAGHMPLVELLAERYGRHLCRPLDPATQVAVTVGATGGLYLALQAALARARASAAPRTEPLEVVALEPFFELYRSQAQALGGELRSVPLKFDHESRSFWLDSDALRRAIGPQTAALIVNTPHNPTGKAFEESELRAIADIVREHPHVCVISDEVYKYMIFDPPVFADEAPDSPKGHIHFASLPGMWDQTITVSSAGKTFGITGWQIGWVVGPTHWIQPIQRFLPNLQFCAPTLMQRALGRVLQIAGQPYDGAPSYYEWLRRDYARRRTLMTEALEAAGVATARSQGGFFLLGDVHDLCHESGPLAEHWAASERPDEPRDWTFSRALAAQLGIVTLPCSPFFGPDAPEDVRTRFVRFCFAKTDETLAEATRRLKTLSGSVAPP